MKKIKQGTRGFTTPYADRFVGRISKRDVQFFITSRGFRIYSLKKSGLSQEEEVLQSPSKYNYSNILCEFKNGRQDQESLSYFKDVFVGIAGQHIKSLQHRGQIVRDNVDVEIVKAD